MIAEQAGAAARIFSVFTDWIRGPEVCCTITRASSGRFEVTLKTEDKTLTFRGHSVQDACAQAAQFLNFDDGKTKW